MIISADVCCLPSPPAVGLIEDNLDTVYESINIFKTIDYVQINKFGDMHLVLKDRHEACSPPWQYIIKRLQSQNDALLK